MSKHTCTVCGRLCSPSELAHSSGQTICTTCYLRRRAIQDGNRMRNRMRKEANFQVWDTIERLERRGH